jgi:hypothetical protein
MRLFFDWAEVWLLFIPLSVLLFSKLDVKKIHPVQVYFIGALFINILIDLSWKCIDILKAKGWGWATDNNVLYNLQSVGRVILFTIFLSKFLSPKYGHVLKWGLIFYSSALLLNFIFLESPLHFSSRIFSAESLFLLTICILYFLSLLNDDRIISYRQEPAVWIAIGLSLYEASNFSIFLFYSILMSQVINFAVAIWDVHNIFYGILCIFSAKAFYECRR